LKKKFKALLIENGKIKEEKVATDDKASTLEKIVSSYGVKTKRLKNNL